MTLLAAITAMLTGHLAPGAVPATELAPAILEASKAYHVDATLITRIVVVESRGIASAENKLTGDYGLMQVNKATQIAYGFTDECLKDWRCNLNAGSRILSDLMKMKGARNCLFNLGPKGRFLRYKYACEKYEVRLAAVE